MVGVTEHMGDRTQLVTERTERGVSNDRKRLHQGPPLREFTSFQQCRRMWTNPFPHWPLGTFQIQTTAFAKLDFLSINKTYLQKGNFVILFIPIT